MLVDQKSSQSLRNNDSHIVGAEEVRGREDGCEGHMGLSRLGRALGFIAGKMRNMPGKSAHTWKYRAKVT